MSVYRAERGERSRAGQPRRPRAQLPKQSGVRAVSAPGVEQGWGSPRGTARSSGWGVLGKASTGRGAGGLGCSEGEEAVRKGPGCGRRGQLGRAWLARARRKRDPEPGAPRVPGGEAARAQWIFRAVWEAGSDLVSRVGRPGQGGSLWGVRPLPHLGPQPHRCHLRLPQDGHGVLIQLALSLILGDWSCLLQAAPQSPCLEFSVQ